MADIIEFPIPPEYHTSPAVKAEGCQCQDCLDLRRHNPAMWERVRGVIEPMTTQELEDYINN